MRPLQELAYICRLLFFLRRFLLYLHVAVPLTQMILQVFSPNFQTNETHIMCKLHKSTLTLIILKCKFFIFPCREMRLVDAYSNECFEPLIISSVPITTLTSWGRKDEFSKLQPTDYSCLEIPRHRASPFPCSDNINNRFIIW